MLHDAAYAEPAFAAGLKALDYPIFPFVGGLIVPTLNESYVAANAATVNKLVRAMFAACRRIAADPAWLLDIIRTQCLEALREHFTFGNDGDVARFARTYLSEPIRRRHP